MASLRVVLTDYDLADDTAGRLLADAGLEVEQLQLRSDEEVAGVAADADALLVQWATVGPATFAAGRRLRFVSRLGIGVDMIDLDAASAAGVSVANTADYCIEEVASHTLALALAAGRGIVGYDRAVRGGAWSAVAQRPAPFRPSQTTFAVVGFGRIGRLVAAQAAALGFRVLAHDPFVPASTIGAAGAEPVSLAEALERGDLVSLHVPLTAETRGLVDAEALARMRPGALLVNTCRGPLVDEDALAAALRAGHLGGAALDVFAAEPLPADSPLRDAPNVILSPHAAWYSPQAMADLPRLAAGQVLDFLAGRPVPNIVNRDFRVVAAPGGASA